MRGTGWPSAANTHHSAPPARSAEATTPRLARNAIAHLRLSSSARLTCSAPANSRNESMPSSSARSSSIAPIARCASQRGSAPSLPSATSTSDNASEKSSIATLTGWRM